MTEFQLYKTDKHKLLIIQIAIIVGVFAVIYFLFPSTNKAIFGVSFFILFVYIAYTEETQTAIGNLIIGSHQIHIITKENELQFELSEIEIIELIYSGYKGKLIVGDIIPKFNKFSGLDNYLKIRKENQVYKYKFLVENELQERELIAYVLIWKSLGCDISNIKINK